MAQCKDCIHYAICEKLEEFRDPLGWVNTKDEFVCSYYHEDADVVPKSEVDRLVDKWIGEEKLTQDEKTLRLIEVLQDEAKRYERYYFNHEYDKLIAETKQEVAREIIREADTALHDMAHEYINAGHPEYFAVCEMVYHKVIRRIEKKYAESEDKS
jgi:hypothetical protein